MGSKIWTLVTPLPTPEALSETFFIRTIFTSDLAPIDFRIAGYLYFNWHLLQLLKKIMSSFVAEALLFLQLQSTTVHGSHPWL